MTWKTVASGTTEALTSIAIDAEQRIWIGGAKGTLLSSEDDGRSFRRQATTAEHVFRGLAWAGGTRLVALSGGSIIAADRGAEPFEFRATTCRARYLYGFGAVSDAIYATGRRGALVRSVDGGVRWKSLKTECKSFLYSVAASTSGQIICAGGDGVVARSIDAGLTWRTIALGYRRYVRGVTILDDGDIISVADSGQVSRIDATGRPHRVDSGTEADLYAVSASNATIIAVGRRVVVTSRGAAWTAEPIPHELGAVCATSTGRVIAVGSGGTILTR